MNFTNKHIILIILTIIILSFVYNYDVYIIEKNLPICKPIYVTKRILTPNAEELLLDNGVPEVKEIKEGMELIDNEIIEGYNTLLGEKLITQSVDNINIPGKTLSNFTISGLTDEKKIKVINNVITVLSNIPTNLNIDIIKQLIEYFSILYQTSSNLEVFYQNVSSSTKIKDTPYNTKYAQLILFLIGKFNNDIEDCNQNSNNECKYINENKNNILNKQEDLPENLPKDLPENLPTNLPKDLPEDLPEYLQENECINCVQKSESNSKISNANIANIKNELMRKTPNKEKIPQNFISNFVNKILPNSNNLMYTNSENSNEMFVQQLEKLKKLPQEIKPCFDKCRVNCPLPQTNYSIQKENFNNIQSNDTAMNYYSLFD